MQDFQAAQWTKAVVTASVLAVAAVGGLFSSQITSTDLALRDGFRAALSDHKAEWDSSEGGPLRLATDTGREPRLWLGSTELWPQLNGRTWRAGERILIRGADGAMAAFDVAKVMPVDGTMLASTRPMLIVVLQPAFHPGASPVRLIVEGVDADEPSAATAKPRTL